MTTRVEVEEIETTRSEKLLAIVLAAFMLVGGVWAYEKVDEIGRPATIFSPISAGSPADRATVDKFRAAQSDAFRARNARRRAVSALELRREAYRTALEAGQPTTGLRTSYADARDRLRGASRNVQLTQARVTSLSEPANAARARQASDFARIQASADGDRRKHERESFLLRLALVLVLLGAGLRLLGHMRRRRSRYLPAALAWIAAAAILAIVMAADYIFDYVEFSELGPLAISLAGIGMTLVAFRVLQRYLASRIPERRTRRGECPFCGYPAGESHCEGCGRRVRGECTSCHGDRRVGTAHCAICGAV